MTGTELFSIAVAVASAIYAFSKNASNIKNDVINAYEKRVKQLEEVTVVMQDRMKELESQAHSKDERIKMMEAVLQGRNPEMVQAIQLMTVHMQTTTKILDNIERFMERLTTHLSIQ